MESSDSPKETGSSTGTPLFKLLISNVESSDSPKATGSSTGTPDPCYLCSRRNEIISDIKKSVDHCENVALQYIESTKENNETKTDIRKLQKSGKVPREMLSILEERSNLLCKQMEGVRLELKMYSENNLITNDIRKELQGVGLDLGNEKQSRIDEFKVIVNAEKYTCDKSNSIECKKHCFKIIEDFERWKLSVVHMDTSDKKEKCRTAALKYINAANEIPKMKERMEKLPKRRQVLDNFGLRDLASEQTYCELVRMSNKSREEISKNLVDLGKELRQYSSENLITDDIRKDLEEIGFNFDKEQESRETRFERSPVCKSEHRTPFCEYCGWPSYWVKSFKKRGIYVKESGHSTEGHIWHHNIEDD